MIDLDKIAGFDWNDGNLLKNLVKHGVEPREAEQVFEDEFVMFLKDVKHSEREDRFHALGKTHEGRHLFVTFTMRSEETLIRVISARDMSKKELACYD